MKPFCHHDGRNVVDLEFAGDSDVFPLYTADALVAARQDAFERAAQQCELVRHDIYSADYVEACCDCASEIRRVAQSERNKEPADD